MSGECIAWQKAKVPPCSTIMQAIQNLDTSALQVVLVVDPSDKLIGTISDGDIRRGLLRGLSLESSVSEVVNEKPLVVTQAITRDLVLDLMSANSVRQIPVVDNHGKVVGLHLWSNNHMSREIDNLIVVMAGGKGTRLRPYTNNRPKPMLEVGGKPILEIIIEKAKKEGFSNFIIAVHYLGEIIEDHFGDGAEMGVNIRYLREKVPLGTAGALALLPQTIEKPFLVTNGDVLTDVGYRDLLDFHLLHEADATMAVRAYEWQHSFGVVHMDGLEIESFEEKPIVRNYVNAGVYILSPAIIRAHLDHNTPIDMPELLLTLKTSGYRVIAYPMHEPWLDVGRPEDLSQAKHNAVDS